MAEWTKAAVLKTVMAQAIVGSNPTPTAIRRGAGVVELDCLLSSYGASHRGFESHPLRSSDKKTYPKELCGYRGLKSRFIIQVRTKAICACSSVD